jgi:hypothetical protein
MMMMRILMRVRLWIFWFLVEVEEEVLKNFLEKVVWWDFRMGVFMIPIELIYELLLQMLLLLLQGWLEVC